MEIQVSTDRHVEDGDRLATFIGYEVVAGLGSYATRVASAAVDLTVASGPARSRALRCWLEVWPRGHAPFAVCRLGSTGEAAVQGAVDDMRHVLERMFHRIDHRSGAAV